MIDSDFRAIVDWCMQSLEQEPDAWTFDGIPGGYEPYYVQHRNGVQIWLANEYYGMAIQYGSAKIGGVTGWSSFFGPLIPWRRKLRHTALRLPHAPKPPRPDQDRILDAIRAA